MNSIKDKLNYKIINICITILLVFLLYKTTNLWISIFNMTLPFILSFIIAYSLYPLLTKMTGIGIPKLLSILLIIILVIGILGLIVTLIFPVLLDQLTSLFNSAIILIKEISMNYEIDFGLFQDTLFDNFNDIILFLSKHISNGIFNVLSIGISSITILVIIISCTIYFLIDMDKIMKQIYEYSTRKSKSIYSFTLEIDKKMRIYFSAFFKIMIISLIEYTLIYLVIGHPNAILLGILASIGNLVPCFGAIIVNIIACLIAFVISPSLFVKTLIVSIIFSLVDMCIINPFVYRKSNKIHPVLVIFSVFIGGALFGMVGIILSIPVTIILTTSYSYIKNHR